MREPNFQDPFEQELADMRPAEVSGSVRRGVAMQLASSRPKAAWRSSLVLRVAAAGMAIAACVTIAVIMFHKRVDPGQVVIRPDPGSGTHPAAVKAAPPPPTLGELRLALARSPEAAEALLGDSAVSTAAMPSTAPRAFGALGSKAWPVEPTY